MALPLAPFGRTGHLSSRVIFGAAALGRMRQQRADEVLPLLLEAGVNHIDVAASYGDAELRLAPWLAAHPDRFFLATKTGDRSGSDARRSLERSLERLGVDHVDLIQLHNLVEPDEWTTAMGPGGALEALVQARGEGLTRYIGVTGHGLRIAAAHRRSLERYHFDSILLPYSPTLMEIPDYRREFYGLMEVCEEREVAVQTIKAVARRRWQDDSTPHHSWYEPLRDEAAIRRAAVQYVLFGASNFFLNSSSDATLLPTILAAAQGELRCPDPAELAADQAAHAIEPLFDGDQLERI